jgi:hypothetical protein
LKKLSFFVIILFFFCELPQSPYTDPDNISLDILIEKNGILYTDTAIQIGVIVQFGDLIDSLKVSFGDNSDTVVHSKFQFKDTIFLKHNYLDSGNINFYIISFAGNSQKVKDTVITIHKRPQRINDSPQFTLYENLKDSMRVETATDTFCIYIKDQDGILKATFSIDGAEPVNALKLNDSLFQIIYTLTSFNKHSIVIIATDSSSELKQASKLIYVNYNTKPEDINETFPKNNEIVNYRDTSLTLT